MARNTLELDMRGIENLLKKFEDLNGDLVPVTEKALNVAAKKITEDTIKGVDKPQLPRGGDYSQGDTEESIVKDPKVEWKGTIAEVSVGFDYDKPGAGGYLIKGRHRPTHMDFASHLNMVYTGKSYMKGVRDEMKKVVKEAIKEKLGGK